MVDTQDTALDALLAGVGGLGFFATIQGINHAAERYNNGGDGVEALFEGAGVAIEGTARGLVGAAELGYKVMSSGPSRFIGRTPLTGARKLDDKLLGGDHLLCFFLELSRRIRALLPSERWMHCESRLIVLASAWPSGFQSENVCARRLDRFCAPPSAVVEHKRSVR